jgi:adenylate kinase family enzyme
MAAIHIFGAPGAGASTLGRSLAASLDWPHFDTDDYHWFTDDPLPYRRRRNPEHRRALLAHDLAGKTDWVLSGTLNGWGDVFVERFDVVIYLWAPASIRLPRIAEREAKRYGPERIAEDGELHGVFVKFCQWAADYDDADAPTRNRAKDLEWLKHMPCPVFSLDASLPEEALLGETQRIIRPLCMNF